MLKSVNQKQKMHSPLTKAKKRIASAVCVLGMIALCLGVVGYQNKLKAEDNLPVVTRGVVDKINQIPESKRNIYDKNADAAKLGTKENPLFILEIVPYVEWGTFGYHISGCEPIDMDQMRGSGYMGKIGSMGIGKVTMEKAFFFGEEPEYKNTKWDSQPVKCTYDAKEFKGYYELVENGQGFFRQQDDGTIVKADGGNIIWHTINSTEMSKKYSSQTFSEKDAQKEILKKTGERIYTKREWTDSEPVYITDNYYTYESNDDFLKDTLQLSEQEADNYSVIIKTITPKELNDNPKWAEYADLYIVTPTIEDSSFVEMWEKFKRYDHPLTANKSNGFENTSSDENRDISWDVAKTMYDKITADKNYAGIMMTALVYRGMRNSRSITLDILDWNLKKIGTKTNVTAYNNNMYKLVVMLTSMKQDLFKRLYLDEEKPLIVGVQDKNTNKKKGIFKLQTGDAQEYWSMYTFLPVGKTGEELSWDWEKYWNDHWQDYEMPGNITTTGKYVNNHVFIGAEGGDILRDYMKSNIYIKNDDVKTTDFSDHIDDTENSVGTPSEAVRYILGVKNNGDDKIKGDLNILDIEPCYDCKNGYSLTKNYIYNMMPDFAGNVNITHMTTAEFIGNSEDLNSTYDMIFMGLDDGAYNKSEDGKTLWNDSKMNGKIYFHTGDIARSAPQSECGSNVAHNLNFLWFGSLETDNEGNSKLEERNSLTQGKDASGKEIKYPYMRFAGNDITKVKQKELSAFLKSGKPIVAVSYLYDTNELRIDQYSNICSFIKEEKRKKDSTLFKSDEATSIENIFRKDYAGIEWNETPRIYDGTTVSEGSSTFKNPNYLATDKNGRNLLPFQFTVKDDNPDHKYKYRIYIDQNRDGKFEDDELYYEGKQFSASDAPKGKTLRISKLFVGLLQWKIMVYRVDNKEIRFTKTGCSAAKNQTGSKIEINVLQIVPNNGGNLNLSNNTLFTKYYENLTDYKITVTTETVNDYMAHFSGENKFSFDESKDVNVSEEGDKNPAKYSDAVQELYIKYNMLIFGFADTYGNCDISNENGAVDFIKFFAARGKSVLFTHDITSMNNYKNGSENLYGYSANTLLRDLMGMNRYKAVNKQLSDEDKAKLLGYQNTRKYDFVQDVTGKELDEVHGFTYFTMKRLGAKNGGPNDEDWNNWYNDTGKNWKMPYRDINGFSYTCNTTKLVTKTNEGQITQYPYRIGMWKQNEKKESVLDDSQLSVASTHGQYFQLDMEDPEVTVWYCLSDKGNNGIYGVSPNDAANNYYIYSKDNIFYSGVGHSMVDSEMEAKLFINTIIGAYRVPYEPPIVEILNPEAEITDAKNLSYSLYYNQEYDAADHTEVLSDAKVDIEKEGAGISVEDPEHKSQDNNPDMVKVRFSPVELNAVTTRLNFSVYYTDKDSEDKHYITTIYHVKEDGTVETLNANAALNYIYQDTPDPKTGEYTEHIRSMDEYYFYYPKAYLSDNWTDQKGETHAKARHDIVFEVRNNKLKETGYTKLNMQTQALFLLD